MKTKSIFSICLGLILLIGFSCDDSSDEQDVKLPTEGLIAHYPFDGTATDVVGGYNGSVYGATQTYGVSGKENTGCYLNGYSYIEVGDYFDNTSKLTFSIWINPDDLVENAIFAKYNSDAMLGGFYLTIRDGHIHFLTSNNYDQRIESESYDNLEINIWQNVILTIDLTQQEVMERVHVYINGTETIMWHFDTDNITTIYNNSVTFKIGKWTDNNGDEWFGYGSYDELRIYNRVLSADEIKLISKTK